jgi:hypothetical protein
MKEKEESVTPAGSLNKSREEDVLNGIGEIPDIPGRPWDPEEPDDDPEEGCWWIGSAI